MSKSKRRPADLNFIAPFPLEQCVQHLAGMRQPSFRLLNKWETWVEFKNINQHTVNFEVHRTVHVEVARSGRESVIRMYITGMLNQIDAQQTHVNAAWKGGSSWSLVMRSLLLTLLILLFMCPLVVYAVNVPLWFIGLLLVSVFSTLIWLNYQIYQEQEKLLEHVADVLGQKNGKALDEQSVYFER